jgi:hypothetical protein
MAIGQYSELKTAVANYLHRDDLTSRIPEFIKLAEDWVAINLRVRGMEASVPLVLTAATSIPASSVSDSATAVTLANSPVKSVNTLGDSYTYIVETTNTGAVDVTIDSISAVNLFKGGSTELEANDLIAGAESNIVFDGTQFQLVSPGGFPLPSRFVQMRRIYLDGSPVRQLSMEQPINFWRQFLSSTSGKPRVFTIEGEFIIFGPKPDGEYYGRMLYYRRNATMSSDADTNSFIDNHGGILLYRSLLEAAPYIGNDPRLLTWSAMLDQLMEDLEIADRDDRYSGSELVAKTDILVDSPDFRL